MTRLQILTDAASARAGLRACSRQLRAALVVLVCALSLAIPTAAMAHAAHPEEVELFSGTDGPYSMLVLAVPYVDYLHVTVVFDPGSTAPLPYEPEVQVSARADSLDSELLGPAVASREAFASTHEYSVTLAAGTPGAWTLFVDVTSSSGEAALTLPVELQHADGIPLSAILTGVGLLAPVVWLVWSARRDKKRPARARKPLAGVGAPR